MSDHPGRWRIRKDITPQCEDEAIYGVARFKVVDQGRGNPHMLQYSDDFPLQCSGCNALAPPEIEMLARVARPTTYYGFIVLSNEYWRTPKPGGIF